MLVNEIPPSFYLLRSLAIWNGWGDTCVAFVQQFFSKTGLQSKLQQNRQRETPVSVANVVVLRQEHKSGGVSTISSSRSWENTTQLPTPIPFSTDCARCGKTMTVVQFCDFVGFYHEKTLYLTYGDGTGPSDGKLGAVYRYDLTNSSWVRHGLMG